MPSDRSADRSGFSPTAWRIPEQGWQRRRFHAAIGLNEGLSRRASGPLSSMRRRSHDHHQGRRKDCNPRLASTSLHAFPGEKHHLGFLVMAATDLITFPGSNAACVEDTARPPWRSAGRNPDDPYEMNGAACVTEGLSQHPFRIRRIRRDDLMVQVP